MIPSSPVPRPAQSAVDSAGKRVKRRTFLRDVFICSLGAYGGPEAHMGVFVDQMVTKKQYLTEGELVELMALCSILPGPTSTQTIVSIGYKTGGPVLALLTMLVWALPVLVAMTLLSFLYQGLTAWNISADVLRFIGPMAVGFIVVAAFRIGRKVVYDTLTALLFAGGALTTYWIRAPWIFPVALLVGGTVAVGLFREPGMWNRLRMRPPWRYLAIFAAFALGLLAVSAVSSSRLVQLAESFYRYGYLVFGGGQVVVPVMHSELVQVRQFMTNEEFLTGYGLVQGLPGPMFSFAAYAGGMAARGSGIGTQIAAAAIAGVGIFLPGLLLIYFVYPLWEDLKKIRAIKIALRGINAVAGGLIAVAAVVLTQTTEFRPDYLVVTAAAASLVAFTKIPAPLIVAATLVAGFLV
ncbi:MAG: chromate efflux transporter [Spirochaetales bacterium]